MKCVGGNYGVQCGQCYFMVNTFMIDLNDLIWYIQMKIKFKMFHPLKIYNN